MMPIVFVNKKTGFIAELPLNGKVGCKGKALISNDNIEQIEVTEIMLAHIQKKHCVYISGSISMLPEDEWIENIEIEGVE